jgi:hypothetical protein
MSVIAPLLEDERKQDKIAQPSRLPGFIPV